MKVTEFEHERLRVKNSGGQNERLTVVCVQRVFALRAANRISRLTCVVSNVGLCVVVYQELAAL